MVFSSLTFLCVFFPAVFLLYYLLPSMPAKNTLLIISSLLFYAYGEPVYVLLMAGSASLNYLYGLWIGRAGKKKPVLALAVGTNFLILGIFKYADMLIDTCNRLTGAQFPLIRVSLPIGISFFTFQALSYLIDVYRGQVKAQKNYAHMLLYISFFPQLIAGPIVKYHDIERQISNRTFDLEETAEGFRRFIVGLSKKVLLSNTAALAADAVFAAELAQVGALAAWIGAVSYLFQIYFDFSGYSDMAIGLGRMFGFTFQENFNYPYISCSVQEFWRRWHISLSTWFKEYLYIPLGGNRKGRARTYVNKLFVFFCTGLWHGADWTFVIWGLYHGLFLLLEGILPVKRLPRALGHVYTMLVVCAGFVIFRADTLSQGAALIGKMFTGLPAGRDTMGFALQQINPLLVLVLVICLFASCPLKSLRSRLPGRWEKILARVGNPSAYVCSIALLVLCMLSLSGGTYNPFIYFRF
ncbi:MAG: MBOAT family protein [Ruminococcus sp.]|jgi:alginate O-acetyltransferase complex protein AlgI|uniref:MBOAT family protein n=1 Tax=Schaedlerella arabinosiphila TaxID=2044587 RepID=A0A3R8KX99_9FIRM|nr:MBOAT family protein [Schaedlerella arabinosiphila]MCI8722408.1 MBOAT family protein [Ruminococcus sp.]MCI9211772.1 MBOAT family protein [Ruminococcus sp.]MCI9603981.1 MBOAT family protein [Ruminococcus sp.]RRK31767.1 MBOAT family protein [Schaedlerella arabinosiphila]